MKYKRRIASLIFLCCSLSIVAQQREYTATSALQYGLFGYYGILLFTIVITLAQYLISKDKAYFYYALYAGLGTFLYGTWQEADFNFLGWGKTYVFKQIAFHGAIPMLLIGYAAYCKFVVEFLNLPEKNNDLAKWYHQIIKAFIALAVVDQIIYCAMRYGTPDIYETVYPPIRIFFLLVTAVLCLMAIARIWSIKNALAKIIFFGTILYFLISLLGLYTFSIARNSEVAVFSNVHPTFFNQVGFLCEIVIFSIGLGYRMKLAEKEKEAATANYIQQLEVNKSLELAQVEAEKQQAISQLRSKLYTNITHEFRTPLTVILGMTDQIKDYAFERQLIRRNSQNLLRLINQLLDVAKLESGNLQLNPICADIIQHIKYCTFSFESIAAEKQIDLTFSSEQQELKMDFDEEKLQQVLYNLLSNAIKFTPTGGAVQIKVPTLKTDTQTQLKIEIIDTGIGIAADDLPSIFDRFYQTDQAQKTAGTGIGLSYTKDIVALMGGLVAVESSLGKGSTFSVFLPITQKAAKKVTHHIESNAPEYLPISPLLVAQNGATDMVNLPHLLLIEDNEDVSIFIERILGQHYQISMAGDGEEGIRQALEHLPDLIISDVMMPKKDGYEVCQTLKTDERTSHIPIVLLTAKAQQSDKVTGLKYGADAYLMKPFDKEELLVRLEQLLTLRRRLQEKYRQVDFINKDRESPKTLTLEDVFLQKVRAIIEEELGNAALSVADVCQKLALSNMQFYRKLKGLTGQTPTLFIRSYRLQKAKHLLKNSRLNVSEIAYDVGFTDPAYFSRAFKNEFNVSPTEFRK